MQNPNGKPGSVHDPAVVLPPLMWERGMRETSQPCSNCKSHPNVALTKTKKRSLGVKFGAVEVVITVCPRCDGCPPNKVG